MASGANDPSSSLKLYDLQRRASLVRMKLIFDEQEAAASWKPSVWDFPRSRCFIHRSDRYAVPFCDVFGEQEL